VTALCTHTHTHTHRHPSTHPPINPLTPKHTHTHPHTHTYVSGMGDELNNVRVNPLCDSHVCVCVRVYACVCMCVCACVWATSSLFLSLSLSLSLSRTHTHNHAFSLAHTDTGARQCAGVLTSPQPFNSPPFTNNLKESQSLKTNLLTTSDCCPQEAIDPFLPQQTEMQTAPL